MPQLVPVDHDPFSASPANTVAADVASADASPDIAAWFNAHPAQPLRIIVHPGHRPNDVNLFGGLLGGDEDGNPAPAPSFAKTVGDQFMQGATGNFSDEITDPLGAFLATAVKEPSALISGDIKDPALAETVAAAPMQTQKELKTEAQNPFVALPANIAGAIVPAIAGGAGATAIGSKLAELGLETPAAISEFAAKYPKIAKAISGSLVGGSGGGVYAAGAGQGDIADRIDSAGNGVLPGAVGGLAGGLLGEKILGAAGALADRASPLLKKAGGLLGLGAEEEAGSVAGAPAPEPVDTTGGLLGQQISPEELANLQQGKALPLTAGDRTQNTVTQRAERTAEEAGSQPILDARAQQRAAAMAPFARALGDQQVMQPADLSLTAQDSAHKVGGILGDTYDQMGSAVDQAYKAADEVGGAQIPINAIGPSDAGASLMDRIHTTIAIEGVTEKQMPDLIDAVGQLQMIVDDVAKNGQSVTTIRELENWKKNAFNRIDPLKQGVKPGEAKRILSMINREYEGFLDDSMQSSIVSGDPEAINAFRQARGLAKERFKFYQTEKGIQKILDDREMSGTDLVNLVFGYGKDTGRGQVGNRAEKMLELAGDRAPEMKAAMQRGAFAKILQASIFPTVDAGNPSANMINFSGMHSALNKLVANKEFFNAVFDETEQDYLKTFNEDLRLIGSAQKGVINGSGTGSRVADILKGIGNIINNPLFKHIPVGGTATSLLQKGLTMQGEAIVTGKAEKGLSEFSKKIPGIFNAPAAFYGGYAGGVLPNLRAFDNQEGDVNDNQN